MDDGEMVGILGDGPREKERERDRERKTERELQSQNPTEPKLSGLWFGRLANLQSPAIWPDGMATTTRPW